MTKLSASGVVRGHVGLFGVKWGRLLEHRATRGNLGSQMTTTNSVGIPVTLDILRRTYLVSIVNMPLPWSLIEHVIELPVKIGILGILGILELTVIRHIKKTIFWEIWPSLRILAICEIVGFI